MKFNADLVKTWLTDLARPFSIWAGSLSVAYATVKHPESAEVVAIAASMAGGTAWLHGKDKVAIAKINAESESTGSTK